MLPKKIVRLLVRFVALASACLAAGEVYEYALGSRGRAPPPGITGKQASTGHGGGQGSRHPTWLRVTAEDTLATTHCSAKTWFKRHERKACHGTIAARPRVAVCLTGQLRAFPVAYANLQGQLLRQLYDPRDDSRRVPRDLYYVGPVDELFREFGGYLLSLPTLKKMYLYRRDVKFLLFNNRHPPGHYPDLGVVEPDETTRILNESMLERIIHAAGQLGGDTLAPILKTTFRDDLSREDRSVLLQRYQAARCGHMIEEAEAREGFKYDTILRSRADIWLHERVPLPARLNKWHYYPMTNECVRDGEPLGHVSDRFESRQHVHDLIEYGARHVMMKELYGVDLMLRSRIVMIQNPSYHGDGDEPPDDLIVEELIYSQLTPEWLCRRTPSVWEKLIDEEFYRENRIVAQQTRVIEPLPGHLAETLDPHDIEDDSLKKKMSLYIGYVRSNSRARCWFAGLENPPSEEINMNQTHRLRSYADKNAALAEKVAHDCLGWRKTSQFGAMVDKMRPGDTPCTNITYDNMFGLTRHTAKGEIKGWWTNEDEAYVKKWGGH